MWKGFIRRFCLRVALFVLLLPCFASETSVNFLLREKQEVLSPFTWFHSEWPRSYAGLQDRLHYGDPLHATTLVLQECLSRRDEKTARWHWVSPLFHLVASSFVTTRRRVPAREPWCWFLHSDLTEVKP